ncbi:MAG: NINE protein [Armatimonadota bacterium]
MNGVSPSQRTACGIVAIVLGFTAFGTFGMHKFMMGKTKAGVTSLLLTFLTCGLAIPVLTVISIVEGIIYLTKSDQDWYHEYIIGGKDWF